MDDIAGECGVSKKTIYQHFSDKDTVVLEVTDTFLSKEESDLKAIHEQSKDPLDELVRISRWFRDTLKNMDTTVIHDMKKYHPRSWKKFEGHKENCVLSSLELNLKRGVELGYYRSNMNTEITSRFRMESAQLAFNGESFEDLNYPLVDIQLELFDLFVYGIVTEKGREIFEKYKNQNS